MNDIRGVIFDLDGTLYAHWKVRVLLLRYALQNMSFLRAFAKVRKHIRHMRPITDFHGLQASMLASCLNCTVYQAQTMVDRLLYTEIPNALQHVTVRRNVRSVLDLLYTHKVPMAILSDFPVGNKLKYLGIEHYWDVIHCSEDSGYLKPHVQPFNDVCAKLQVAPAQVLFIGDSYDYDIRGAHSLGMMSAHLSHMRGESDATLQFSRYSTLLYWLQQVFCFAT